MDNDKGFLKPGDFNTPTAFFIGGLCDLAYKSRYQVEKIIFNEYKGYWVDCFDDPITDTQGFVCGNPKNKSIVVIYRGTEIQNINDFQTDLDFKLVNFGRGYEKVHKGGLQAVIETKPIILDIFKDRKVFGDYENFFVGGHSLGGLVSTIFGASLCSVLSYIYTLGAPRAGNRLFAASLDKKRFFRLAVDHDVVTRIPFQSMGYSHGGELYFLKDNKIFRDYKLSLWADFWDRMGDWEWGEPIFDHKLSGYLEILGNSYRRGW